MRKLTRNSFYLLLVFCAGCSQIGPSIPPTPTLLPLTHTAISSASPSPTQTLEPTFTLTPTQELQVITYELLTELPEGAQMDGVVVMVHQVPHGGSDDMNAYLVSGRTGEKVADLPTYPTISGYLYGFAVSPNGQWLAYYSQYLPGYPVHLYVVDAEGRTVVDQLVVDNEGEFALDKWTPGAGKWGRYIYWLDNERLITEKWPPTGDFDKVKPFSPVLYEPFNGTAVEYPPDYPGITIQWPSIIPAWNFEAMVFDPTMTRLVYGKDNGDVILWNLETGSEILKLANAFTDSEPVWAHDGSSFVIGFSNQQSGQYHYSEDLTLVSKDGEVTRLTYLEDEFNDVRFHFPRWSPDNGTIAFLVSLSPDPCTQEDEEYESYLATLNLDLPQELNLFCIGSGDLAPVWSLDGQQILFSPKRYAGWEDFETILLDLREGYAAIWIEGDYPAAWMPEPQE